MALTTTTLSSAVVLADNSIVVASATGFAAGNVIRVDNESMKVAQHYVSGTTIPVLRGQDGTAARTHQASANVTTGLPSDFSTGGVAQGVTSWPIARQREMISYSAAGAITHPTAGNDMLAIINGTSALAMTLAVPTKEMDGSVLTIVANGKAAHTVTATGGLGAGSTTSDVGTFSASYQGGAQLMAVNGVWVLIGNGIYTATAAVGAPLWA